MACLTPQAHRIAHRDIKADNLLSSGALGHETFVLADFGICLDFEALQLQQMRFGPLVDDSFTRGGSSETFAPEVRLNYCADLALSRTCCS